MEEFRTAIKMDETDPNNIQQELIATEKLQKAKDLKADKKMGGFLKNGL